MAENLLVALSNLPVILPIMKSIRADDNITLYAITFVGYFSFVSHLAENHKHGMPGWGSSKKVSYILNRLDVLGCFLAGSRFLYLYYNKYGLDLNIVLQNKLFFSACLIPFLFMAISEYDKYNVQRKRIYIITHSLWHIGIYTSMYFFMENFIYN